ncbi:hypothetical protein [Brevundimonas sp.]|uniref:hypothetical protein n=1 Tax=Brevundimonas sp. TaxID=1871086 RepID=UPI0037C01B98
MSYMQIASEETLRAGRKIVEQYGSWSAAIAAGERRDDGVVILPASPPAQPTPPSQSKARTKKPAPAA